MELDSYKSKITLINAYIELAKNINRYDPIEIHNLKYVSLDGKTIGIKKEILSLSEGELTKLIFEANDTYGKVTNNMIRSNQENKIRIVKLVSKLIDEGFDEINKELDGKMLSSLNMAKYST